MERARVIPGRSTIADRRTRFLEHCRWHRFYQSRSAGTISPLGRRLHELDRRNAAGHAADPDSSNGQQRITPLLIGTTSGEHGGAFFFLFDLLMACAVRAKIRYVFIDDFRHTAFQGVQAAFCRAVI